MVMTQLPTRKIFHCEGVVWTLWRPNGCRRLCSTSKTFLKGQLVQQPPLGLQSVTVSWTAIPTQAQITGLVTFQGTTGMEDIESLEIKDFGGSTTHFCEKP
jgi:hypothetical protein